MTKFDVLKFLSKSSRSQKSLMHRKNFLLSSWEVRQWSEFVFSRNTMKMVVVEATFPIRWSRFSCWVETPSNNPWPAICPDRCQNSNDQQYSVAAHRCTVSIFQNIMGAVAITTSSSILSYLQALFGWIWSLISSKHIWLQAIQILNIMQLQYPVRVSQIGN